jgi:hypothetical protein
MSGTRGVRGPLFSRIQFPIEVIVVVAPSLVPVELIILMLSFLLSREAELSPSQSLKAARVNKRENDGSRESCDAAFPRKVQGPYRRVKNNFVILGGNISHFVNTFSLPR